MALVGKERVLARIDRALAYIEARMAAEEVACCRDGWQPDKLPSTDNKGLPQGSLCFSRLTRFVT
ncbi:Glutamyl-tRNA synthetase [Aeromonas salmonicida]|nr:Glutamyl-tRNA synthetase [Aeromonas salmonicida]